MNELIERNDHSSKNSDDGVWGEVEQAGMLGAWWCSEVWGVGGIASLEKKYADFAK